MRVVPTRWTAKGNQETKYSQLQSPEGNEDHVESCSSDEEQPKTKLRKSRTRIIHRRTTWSWYIALGSWVTNIFILLGLYMVLKHKKPMQNSYSVFPPGEYETRVFDPVGMLPGAESDAVWDEDLPKTGGFTIIDDPDKFDLPPGVPYHDGFQKYGVSWAHQYHCLRMLRDEFFSLLANTSNLIGVEVRSVEDELSPEARRLWHLIHCYGFLRQIVVCNMDMTLEYPTGKGVKRGTIDGYEIPHQCVKRGVFDEYMIQHGPKGHGDHQRNNHG